MTRLVVAAAGAVLIFTTVALSFLPPAEKDRFGNREAWVIHGSRLDIRILQSGGHIGEVKLKDSDAVNPLWVQSRPTMDAEEYDPLQHEKTYGGGSAARLLAGLLGHNVCFPFWGDPSAPEAAAGMTYHGETGIVRWKEQNADVNALSIMARLPESGTSMTRTFHVRGQVVEVESVAQNQKAWDRPVGWCEHVTLGPPFLERGATVMEASLTRGRMSGGKETFLWPNGFAEKPVNLRRVRNLKESTGFVNNFLVDPKREYGFLAAFHPKYRLVFGYVFPRADYPWLNIWESNTPEMLTRGLEFSNTPVHGTLRTLMKTPELWGVPTFNWLDAKGNLVKRFWIFSLRVPETFKGVADVRFQNGRIDVVEIGTGRALIVPQE